jgi:hypothetical protein
MPDMMLQFHHEGGKPRLEQARALFDLAEEEVDTTYGVATTDPVAGLYVILVKPEAEAKVRTRLGQRPKRSAEGLYGNPRVEPMGPPHHD